MLAATAIIFADHHQFYVYDSSYDHYGDPRLDWKQAPRLAYGYLATERAVYVSTVAALHTHRLRVFVNQAPGAGYKRVFSADLSIDSGTLAISAPANDREDDVLIDLPAGAYRLSVCSNNLGTDELNVEPDRDEPLDDEAFLQRDDIEYYDLFVERRA